jgi:AcrR family transcriptional regulator
VDGVHLSTEPGQVHRIVTKTTSPPKPERLNRKRVLEAAVDLADEHGIAAVSMRNLADHLGVVPMAMYKHVANKDELLDGMVDVIIGEIPTFEGAGRDWKPRVRRRILSTRTVLQKHPWARTVIETRTTRSEVVLDCLNGVAELFITGGLSADLTHHVMHAIGSRVWGFTQDVFDAANDNAVQPDPATMLVLTARFPHLAEVAAAVGHDTTSVVGAGCDDQFEFEFALDLLLDGIERLHKQHWRSTPTTTARTSSRSRRRSQA